MKNENDCESHLGLCNVEDSKKKAKHLMLVRTKKMLGAPQHFTINTLLTGVNLSFQDSVFSETYYEIV